MKPVWTESKTGNTEKRPERSWFEQKLELEMQEKDSEEKNQFEQRLGLEMQEKDFKEKTGLNRETRFADIMQILRCK